MATSKQRKDIVDLSNNIIARVDDGSLDPVEVIRLLQDINDGILPVNFHGTPSWWRTPEQQIERARSLWPDVILPIPPKRFNPSQARCEVLLLHVPDSFESLWSKATAPDGYEKADMPELGHLYCAPNKVKYSDPVWLLFDPERGKGESPDTFWYQADVAGPEVLSAIIQFPQWPLMWYGKGLSSPYLAGYQTRPTPKQTFVPCLDRWDGYIRELSLSTEKADSSRVIYASPSVRKY